MRIQILSDLHLEFGPLALPIVDVDVVVLAGDIYKKARGVRWANETFKVPVIYVLGNHEFYGDRIDRVIRDCREAAAPHVHVLDNDSIEIDGVRFLGCTLWTDLDLFGTHRRAFVAEECQRVMTDFKCIRLKVDDRYPMLTPGYSARLHKESVGWLTERLAEGDLTRTVVVTHHAPHRGSLAAEFAHDLVSGAYVSELGDLVGRTPLWIHGHTHTSFDYRVDDTRVICNPRGYAPNDLNESFRPALMVEVP